MNFSCTVSKKNFAENIPCFGLSCKYFAYFFLEEDEFDYKEMLTRDKRRWAKADVDKDNKVTKEEYTAFLHPEEYDHMKDVVVDETLEDIDKDGDGFVSIEEYLGRLCFTTITVYVILCSIC